MTHTDDLGKQEAVLTASFIMNMIADHLMDHRAVVANPKWRNLVTEALDAISEVYQVMAADTMCANTLKSIIRAKSFRTGDFTLSSGQKSKYFFDLKPTILDPAGVNLIADAVLQKLQELGLDHINAIGGVAVGAVPIASVVSAKSYLQSRLPIPAFIVRKATKDHGTGKLIEGDLKPGWRVVLLEDVTTTGAATIAGITAIRAAGCSCDDVIAVVDRLEGAALNLQAIGVTLHPLFTRADFEDGT